MLRGTFKSFTSRVELLKPSAVAYNEKKKILVQQGSISIFP